MTKHEAIALLRDLLKPGDTVYTILRHRARSGMMRRISAVKIGPNGGTFDLDYLIEAAGLFKAQRNKEGLVLIGCGMDMGFHLVYELSSMLYPDGFGCVGRGPDGSGIYCPSNDHANGDHNYTPHDPDAQFEVDQIAPSKGAPRRHWHRSGGYALRHRWL